LLIAVLGIALAIGGGFAVSLLMGRPTFESFFIGVVIASSSTSITIEALQEMGRLKSRAGTAIMGAAVIDDILCIIMFAIVLGMGTNGFSGYALGVTMLKIIFFFAFATLGGFGVHKLFDRMSTVLSDRKMLSIFALAYCFLMAFLAEQFGLADLIGAYLAGLALCNTRCVEYLEEHTHVLSYMLLTPVFLANIGLHASLDGITRGMVLFALALVGVAVFSKIIGCGIGARMSGYNTGESLQIGVGLIARGEVSVIMASKGILAGLFLPDKYSMVIIIVLITVLIMPILLDLAYKIKPKE
jgi:Kef-type K+ transport system membrane component KefB